MKKIIAGVVLFVATVATFNVQAIPAFARQTDQACTACHAQHFPTLNAFGRMFKASGFTMVGSQPQVRGDGLELPVTLNMALIGNMQYVGSGQSQEFGLPAAISLYIAGKAGDKAGFVFEVPFKQVGTDTVAAFGSYKVNYIDTVADMQIGAIGFSTEMAGPAYGYELMSTGAMGMNVAQTGSNAMGAIGLHMEHGATLMSKFMGNMNGMSGGMSMAGKATGVGVSFQDSNGYVYLSKYSNMQAVGHLENPKLADYARVVWTPYIFGLDMGIGTQMYFGKTSVNGTVVDAVATTYDLQAQGVLLSKPIGIYLTHATSPKSGSTGNYFNSSNGGDNVATGALVELGVMDRVSASLGYVQATYWMGTNTAPVMGMGGMGGMSMPMSTMAMGQKGTASSAGMEYLFRPNVRMALRVTKFGGDFDEVTTVATIYAGM